MKNLYKTVGFWTIIAWLVIFVVGFLLLLISCNVNEYRNAKYRIADHNHYYYTDSYIIEGHCIKFISKETNTQVVLCGTYRIGGTY